MKSEWDKIVKVTGAEAEPSPVDWDDPFVRWIAGGGFVYFDFKYDIVAINALCTTQVTTPQQDRAHLVVRCAILQTCGKPHSRGGTPSNRRKLVEMPHRNAAHTITSRACVGSS